MNIMNIIGPTKIEVEFTNIEVSNTNKKKLSTKGKNNNNDEYNIK